MRVYVATAFLDGPLLAARAAADLAALGIEVPRAARWWAYDDHPDAKTLIHREEDAVLQCGRVLVLLTDACGIGTGYEIGFARAEGLPIYWIDCGRTKEIPLVLAAYGVRVGSLQELAKRIVAPAEIAGLPTVEDAR